MIRDTPISELKKDQILLKGIEGGLKGKALVKKYRPCRQSWNKFEAEGVENIMHLEYLN